MEEEYLAKWLNNELSTEELLEFKKTETYAAYVKNHKTAGDAHLTDFDTEQAWKDLGQEHTEVEPKAGLLSPFKGFLTVAALIVLLLVGAYVYQLLVISN